MTSSISDTREANLKTPYKCWSCPNMHNKVHNGKVQAYCNPCHAAYMRKWRMKKSDQDARNAFTALVAKHVGFAEV